MRPGVFVGVVGVCIIDVVRMRFADAFGDEARASLVFVAIVFTTLLLVYCAYPDWE